MSSYISSFVLLYLSGVKRAIFCCTWFFENYGVYSSEIFGTLAQAMNVMFLFLEVTGVYKFKCVVYSTVLFL